MTIYYTVGTVTLTNNSTAVTGSGTAWLTNGIRAGDWLILRNQIAVIATVTSNTALTIETAWVPASASVSAYAIARVDDGVRALQATNDLLAAFSAGPAQGRFGDGSAATPGVGFTSQTNTGLFRPATSVLALSVNGVERMRASATGVNVVGDLTVGGSPVYARANLLGTVSQTAGVPTGAVIQRGSNANGEFVRFADGTQIVVQPFTFDFAATPGSRTASLTFPAAFVARPALAGVSTVIPITIGSLATASRLAAMLAMDRDASATAGRIISPLNGNSVWDDLGIDSAHTLWQAVYIGHWF